MRRWRLKSAKRRNRGIVSRGHVVDIHLSFGLDVDFVGVVGIVGSRHRVLRSRHVVRIRIVLGRQWGLVEVVVKRVVRVD